jgi:hypothetical protein
MLGIASTFGYFSYSFDQRSSSLPYLSGKLLISHLSLGDISDLVWGKKSAAISAPRFGLPLQPAMHVAHIRYLGALSLLQKPQ